jgi:L-rhamnose-H+ transport protein
MFGMILAAIAGLSNGSFGLPMKFTTKWKWENTWSMWSVWTLLVVPWIIAFLTIPNLLGVYSEASWGALLWVFLFGFIWGFSAIAFGTGLDYLGLGLGYSLMMGLIISVGALLPLVTEHPENILKLNGLAIIAGVVIIIVGVILNTWSAVMKEKDLVDSTTEDKHVEKKSLLKGLIICVVAGVTAPALNYVFIYGEQLRATAERLSVGETLASISIWPIALLGGFLVNITYCTWLVNKNKVWGRYCEKGTCLYYLYTLIMGIFWAGSTAIYGMAAANLGKLGPSIGWAILLGTAILWANILGIFTGEWKGVSKKALWVMTAGLVVLLSGICIVGWAKFLTIV